MKRNEIVDFKLASILKEHNYDRECLFRIDEKDTLYSNDHMLKWNCINGKYSAPTLSEASDWILERYNIFIEVTYNDYGDNKFNYAILDLNDGTLLLVSVKTFSTKFKALESAIFSILRRIDSKVEKTYRKIEEYKPETNKVKAELV